MATTQPVFPGKEWRRVDASELGLSAEGLYECERWLYRRANGRPYRALVVRHGRVAGEWAEGLAADARSPLASVAKSVYGCILGIAVAEGVVDSPEAKVTDYYPELMDVAEGEGPRPGRFARSKDRDITFRQLISNTSGYLKPREVPGEVFHYQTFGMNVLCHAVATAYGYYSSADPDRLPGFGKLIEEKIRNPIGGTWTWEYTNFELSVGARTNIFGNYTQLIASPEDMARLGWLWCNMGRWRRWQVVPSAWMREAVKVSPEVQRGAPEAEWTYGLGFWTNERGRLWPDLPTDSFAAAGAGSQLIWVCPSLALVVVESPGLFEKTPQENRGLLRRVVEAVADGP